jgi:5-hydroxyisourate hydrolase
MSGLTTHVLDTTHGRPAAGMALRLMRGGELLAEARTNADGRCDGPLLDGDSLSAGAYRLEFDVGPYFRGLGVAMVQPAFLETVAIEFGVAESGGRYHVPLLVSPFAYSTYRGS